VALKSYPPSLAHRLISSTYPVAANFIPAFATERCEQEEPELATVGENHEAACWHWEQVVEEIQQKGLRGRK